MKCRILSEIDGRMRVRLSLPRMSLKQADIVEEYLGAVAGVKSVKVFDRNCDVVVEYSERTAVVSALAGFSFETCGITEPKPTGRELNCEYQDKLAGVVMRRVLKQAFLPVPWRAAICVAKCSQYFARGVKSLWHKRLDVAVLDATAITVSVLRGDTDTASSIMFMLKIGDILEEWTHKKSVDDLARTMSLNVDKVWVKSGDTEELKNISDVNVGDDIIVRMGSMIPLDGKLVSGSAAVNQSSMTGESMPVRKEVGSYVYGGTVVEEGECVVRVEKSLGSGRYDRIVHMIEDSEKLKSDTESQAYHLADRLVPYSLGATALTWLITRNPTKALAILMVDFSCALKLSMPIAVLSAMRESGANGISVKGGKFLEIGRKLSWVAFDKTGTLTNGRPEQTDFVPFGGMNPQDAREIAASLAGRSDHPVSKAISRAAEKDGLALRHVDDFTALPGRGTSGVIDGETWYLGNHALVESLGRCSAELEKILFALEKDGKTVVVLVGDSGPAGLFAVADTIRATSAEAIDSLKKLGVKTIMLTGDNKHTAAVLASRSGVDSYEADLLPEDKLKCIENIREQGLTVGMVGDGINDSPALAKADIGFAMAKGGTDSAIETADVALMDDDIRKVPRFIRLCRSTFAIVLENIIFALGVKAVFFVLAFTGLATMWMAVFADGGTSLIVACNAVRALKK